MWRIGGLIVSAALIFAPAVHAAPSSAALRLNHYFEHPDAPETFRALTGQGDPQIPPADRAAPWDRPRDTPDAALFLRLFPGAAGQSSLDPGACRPDYALQTLKARIAQLGADHPYVRRWVEVQRAVFAPCLPGVDKAAAADLPPPLHIDDKALARLQVQDRAYQVASAAFYRGDMPAALAGFGKIARGESPHRATAVYMAAAIRAGTQKGLWMGAKPLVPAARSVAEVQAILADPSLASVHPQARALLGWIGATAADDASRRAQVLATLADLEQPAARLAQDPAARARYALARGDIDELHFASLQGDPSWWLLAGPPPDFTASRALMDAAGTDPMAAWVLFPASYVQGHAWAPFAEVGARGWGPLQRYAETAARGEGPSAFAWMRVARSVSLLYLADLWPEVEAEQDQAAGGDARAIAALSFDFYHQVRLALSASHAPGEGDPRAFDAAVAHLRSFPFKDSEVYAAARHDGLQYLMTVGRIAEARRWRDETPPAMDPVPAPYQDAALLQVLAEDAAHFTAALGRGDSEGALPLQNTLSTPTLRSLAARNDAPAVLRARFARVAWARTYALGRTIDPDLDRLMRKLNPAMTAAWSSKPGRPVRANDRRVLLDVLRSPALNILIVDADRDAGPDAAGAEPGPGLTRIDLYNHDDDNWWCAWRRGRNRRDLQRFLRETFYGSADLTAIDGETAYDLQARLAPMLAASYAFRGQDAAEAEALSRIPCAPKLLAERVLDWVRRPGLFETRDGEAEALALAVRATHFGCYSDGPHGVYSKAAWTLLHQRFPTTDWATRTRYWFGCPFGDKTCPASADD